MSRRTTPPKFRRHLIAVAASAALNPALALDLASSPPGTVQPYVAPNVILSLDDSTSMNEWDMINGTKSRTAVLKDALKEVFSDKTLIPDGKLRLAWQSFGMNGGWNGCTSVSGFTLRKLDEDAAKKNNITNTMRILDEDHRSNFLKYVNNFKACASTPTHWMVKQADEYMRAPLHKNGPWADIPGERLASPSNNNKPLGCRRNYHILLTDGDWNGTYYKSYPVNTSPVNFDNQDSKRNIHGKEGTSDEVELFNPFKLPDGTEYNRDDPNTWVYRDIDFPTWSSWHPGYNNQYLSSLADWTFKSWATELQNPANLTGQVSPLPEYLKAPETETFTNPKTGKTATLKKYWNPRYNPATWPHMVTFTIGFSNDSIPTDQFRPIGNDSEAEKNIGRYWIDKKIGDKWYEAKDGPLWQYDGPYLAKSSNAATNNGNNGKLIKPSSTLPYGYDGSFADYAAGRAQWYSVKGGGASQDMWHAAINGRGQFYAVEKGEDLKEAFRQIVRTINTEVDPSITSTATSGSNISRNSIGQFTGNYEPQNAWKGFVSAENINTDGSSTPIEGWGGKNTAQKLDELPSHESRVILSWSDKWEGTSPKGGVPFVWSNDESNLSTTQKLALRKATNGTDQGATAGRDRLNYIRGDRSKEGTDPSGYTDAKPYRQRYSRQGDIVNSEVWYTGAPASNYAFKGYDTFINTYKDRTPMLYVGGNDGMLHGFSAKDGSEKIAYVPQGVIPHLNQLTAPAYNQQHRYFVDGSPMTGDVDINNAPDEFDPTDKHKPTYTPNWRTLLVGTLGAGGRGYFVLDVTNPANFSAAQAANLVVLDRTRSAEVSPPDCTLEELTDTQKTACTQTVEEDRDIGHITAAPVRHSNNILRTTQITLMNNNRWAVVLGNGYNSANQRPVLLVQYLDGDRELLRIPVTDDTPGTGKADDNGLSAPRLVDLNGDDRPDIAYAGDNQGNLWKFDLTSYNAKNWGVAFNGEPLFTAQRPAVYGADGTELPQPITVAPTVRANDRTKCTANEASGECEAGTTTAVGGMMVAFGTGRNVARNDPESTAVQTLYSVLDNTRYRYKNGSTPKRLEIHPGKTCGTGDGTDCIDVAAPQALGAGVDTAKLLKQTTTEVSGDQQATLGQDPLKATNWGDYNGWYLDLPSTGERLLKPMEFYDGSNILTVYSQVPAKGSNVFDTSIESCESSSVDDERQYRTFINIMDGATPSIQLMAVADGTTDIMVRRQVHKGAHTLITAKDQIKDKDTRGEVENLNRMPETTSRPSWRQMQ